MSIYVNQLGYKPDSMKHATISGEHDYSLINEKGDTVLTGSVKELSFDECSGENVAVIDFSGINTPGTYHFKTSGGESCHFTISGSIYDDLAVDSLKMFYFQRCGMELTPQYAGRFARKSCHTGKVTVLRSQDKAFECSGGWHDAGDFGRYVTAGSVALAHLLYAYKLNPDKFSFELNIPETGNGMPDILNECRYELEWMLKMQLSDGSVYHKCTSIRHTDFLMPSDDPLPFIVTPVSSLAVADFAAITALSEGIYRNWDAGFADRLRSASLKAFDWLEKNPSLLFENPPECTTGDYGDNCDIDERMWATAEVCKMTGRKDLQEKLYNLSEYHLSTTALGWRDVGGLAALAVLTDTGSNFNACTRNVFKSNWLDEADRLLKLSHESAFDFTMRFQEIRWGSNLHVLSNADILAFAGWLTDDAEYTIAAANELDYILGRNPMNTSYVTGYGEKAFRNPHNRPTASDGIDDPAPGYVSGGPNGHPCDEAACRLIPDGTPAMKCYVDVVESYSTNEIAIYWNSPLVFLLSFLR